MFAACHFRNLHLVCLLLFRGHVTEHQHLIPCTGIPDGWIGIDIGPASQVALCDVIRSSKTIIWNGPPGVFEMSNFSNGDAKICRWNECWGMDLCDVLGRNSGVL
jgi:3-phosphoglycerate kinase